MQNKVRIHQFIQMWSGVPLDIRYTYGYELKVMVQYPDLDATFHFLGIRMMRIHTCRNGVEWRDLCWYMARNGWHNALVRCGGTSNPKV